MTKFLLSWQQYHIHQMSITQPVHCCVETNRGAGGGRKTIMFLSSKLCLLIALLLGWLLMDITFHAVPQAAVWTSAFRNERLCDAPLKLVQHGIIHHPPHCQWGAAASPCLPVTMGLQGELLSATSRRCALHWATEIAFHIHLKWLRHSVAVILESILEVLPPHIYCALKDSLQTFLLRGENSETAMYHPHKNWDLKIAHSILLFLCCCGLFTVIRIYAK